MASAVSRRFGAAAQRAVEHHEFGHTFSGGLFGCPTQPAAALSSYPRTSASRIEELFKKTSPWHRSSESPRQSSRCVVGVCHNHQ
eukprot:354470-Chlamydomonas_euryale.AAC.51